MMFVLACVYPLLESLSDGWLTWSSRHAAVPKPDNSNRQQQQETDTHYITTMESIKCHTYMNAAE